MFKLTCGAERNPLDVFLVHSQQEDKLCWRIRNNSLKAHSLLATQLLELSPLKQVSELTGGLGPVLWPWFTPSSGDRWREVSQPSGNFGSQLFNGGMVRSR
ncbi:unnamed protein product [Rangifer tarandus platyrhynchus]|uniref:Uncharacterized protein n=2 Tax=Rangifer tarandus platyrhynchus TaxID=3082113 RepID=A0ABN9A414_RANTA|nr:unnamed protein product [Rangifer tarandus platyrhynchus]